MCQCIKTNISVALELMLYSSTLLHKLIARKEKNRVKMKFKCCICGELADYLDLTINHLKNDHKIKSNSQKLECIANNSCSQKYSNYKSLRKHVTTCVTSSNIPESNILPTSVAISIFILFYHAHSNVHILIIRITPSSIGKSNSSFKRKP